MKRMITVLAVGIALGWFAGCGGSTVDEDRLISGTIELDAAADLSKAVDTATGCIGEICGMAAYGSGVAHVEGEIDPATNRWRIRVRAGNWMFGFLDGEGNRLGYLEMNGIPAVTVEDGDDIDLGSMRLRDGAMVMNADAEGLGLGGIYTYRYRDRNRNGMPDDFEGLSDDSDTASFDVLLVRPFDNQDNVAPCRPIKILFNTAIDETSATVETMIVELDDGTPVEGTLTVLNDAEYEEYEIRFAPIGGYPLGSSITVTIVGGAEGILSQTGDELAADIIFTFTVRDFGGTSLVCHDPDDERYQERERFRLEGSPGNDS